MMKGRSFSSISFFSPQHVCGVLPSTIVETDDDDLVRPTKFQQDFYLEKAEKTNLLIRNESDHMRYQCEQKMKKKTDSQESNKGFQIPQSNSKTVIRIDEEQSVVRKKIRKSCAVHTTPSELPKPDDLKEKNRTKTEEKSKIEEKKIPETKQKVSVESQIDKIKTNASTQAECPVHRFNDGIAKKTRKWKTSMIPTKTETPSSSKDAINPVERIQEPSLSELMQAMVTRAWDAWNHNNSASQTKDDDTVDGPQEKPRVADSKDIDKHLYKNGGNYGHLSGGCVSERFMNETDGGIMDDNEKAIDLSQSENGEPKSHFGGKGQNLKELMQVITAKALDQLTVENLFYSNEFEDEPSVSRRTHFPYRSNGNPVDIHDKHHFDENYHLPSTSSGIRHNGRYDTIRHTERKVLIRDETCPQPPVKRNKTEPANSSLCEPSMALALNRFFSDFEKIIDRKIQLAATKALSEYKNAGSGGSGHSKK